MIVLKLKLKLDTIIESNDSQVGIEKKTRGLSIGLEVNRTRKSIWYPYSFNQLIRLQ